MDTEWDELRTSAEQATKYGQLEEAAQFWLTALEKSIDFGKYDPRRILTLESLASVYWRRGQYADALPILVKTFELHEDQLGPDHADIGVLANNLAMLYHTLEQFKQAEDLYKRALRIRRKVVGCENPEVAELIKNYSNLLVAAGRAMEAEDLKASTVSVKTGVWNRSGHFKALEIAAPEALMTQEPEAAPEPEPENRGISDEELHEESTGISAWLNARKANNSAPVDEKPRWVEMMAKGFQAVKEDNLLQGEQYFRKALTAAEEFDPSDVRIANTLESLSEVLWKNGNLADAEPLCERTLRYYESTLKPEHLDIGVVSNNLAMLYHALDKFEEAEPLYKRAITIRTTSQGTSHPDVVSVLTNYANLLYVTQRESEAVNLKNYVRSVTSGKWNQVGVFKAMQPNQAPDLNSSSVNQYETFSRLKPDLKMVAVSSTSKTQEEADSVARGNPSELPKRPADVSGYGLLGQTRDRTADEADEWAIKPEQKEQSTLPSNQWEITPETEEPEPIEPAEELERKEYKPASDEWALRPDQVAPNEPDLEPQGLTDEWTITSTAREAALKQDPDADWDIASAEWAIDEQPKEAEEQEDPQTGAAEERKSERPAETAATKNSDDRATQAPDATTAAAEEETTVATRTKTLEEVRAEELAMFVKADELAAFNSVGTQSLHDLPALSDDPRPVLDRLFDVIKKKEDNGNEH